MKTTYNKREIAQRERAKNLAIYNEAAAIAREVFNCLDIEAGKYSAAEVAAADRSPLSSVLTAPALTVMNILSPVSPSGIGKTFKSLTAGR